MSSSLIIIGSGWAGYTLVKELRELGSSMDITLITADKGDYYSKPLLSTAIANDKTADDLIMQNALQMADKFSINIITETTVDDIDVDNKQVVCGNEQIPYDKLVLTLGAHTIKPELTGDAAGQVIDVNTLEDYAEYRQKISNAKHIAILGAGLVSVEFANDLALSGYSVTVIAPDLYPCQRFVPEVIGKKMQQALAKIGVEWRLGCIARSIDKVNNELVITLENGEQFNADIVLSAIGLAANKSLAEKASLTINKGIVVDKFCRTSNADVFAFGDCAEVAGELRMHIAPLLICARALAKTLTGDDTEACYPPMPIGIKTPSFPTATLVPLVDSDCHWSVEGDGDDLVARYISSDDALRGFCLSGKEVRQRMKILQEIAG